MISDDSMQYFIWQILIAKSVIFLLWEYSNDGAATILSRRYPILIICVGHCLLFVVWPVQRWLFKSKVKSIIIYQLSVFHILPNKRSNQISQFKFVQNQSSNQILWSGWNYFLVSLLGQIFANLKKFRLPF